MQDTKHVKNITNHPSPCDFLFMAHLSYDSYIHCHTTAAMVRNENEEVECDDDMNVVQCVGELAAYEEYADTGTLPTLQPPPRHTTLYSTCGIIT